MSGFQKMLQEDLKNVFLSCDEFAEERTIIYDGETYENVPVILSGIKEKNRTTSVTDHAQGLHIATHVLHCARESLCGNQPEVGQRLKLSDEQNPRYFHSFYVSASLYEFGMLRVELEAITE